MCIEHMHACVQLIIRVEALQRVSDATCNGVTCLTLLCLCSAGALWDSCELNDVYELTVNEFTMPVSSRYHNSL